MLTVDPELLQLSDRAFLGILPLLLTAGVIYYSHKRQDKVASTGLSLFALGIFLLIAGKMVQYSVTTLTLKTYTNTFIYTPGYVFVGIGLFKFSIDYTQLERLRTLKTRAIIFAPIVFYGLFIFTEPLHNLAFENVSLKTDAGRQVFDISYTAIPNIIQIYWNLLFTIALGVLFAKGVLSKTTYARKQAIAILAGLLLPPVVGGITGMIFESEWYGFIYIYSYSISALLFAYAVKTYRPFNIKEVITRRSLDETSTGSITISSDNRILQLNHKASEILGIENSDEGTTLQMVRNDIPETLYKRLRGTVNNDREILELYTDSGLRYISMEEEELHIGVKRNKKVGTIYTIQDVTESQKREQELREKKQYHEILSSMLSHDVRNPLTIASSRTELLKQSLDEDDEAYTHIESIEEAHQRIEEILTNGMDIIDSHEIETEQVDVKETAKEAWSHIEASNTILEVDTNERIIASKSHLLNILENLFKNSVKYGGDKIYLTLQNDELIIEDNGPGIDEGEQKGIFDYGETGSNDSTGYGLAIVKTLAEKHNWSVRLSDENTKYTGESFTFSEVERIGKNEKIQSTEDTIPTEAHCD